MNNKWTYNFTTTNTNLIGGVRFTLNDTFSVAQKQSMIMNYYFSYTGLFRELASAPHKCRVFSTSACCACWIETCLLNG